ncbi:hypothetical protein LguiB_007629 [Lonicera macranthoides]
MVREQWGEWDDLSIIDVLNRISVRVFFYHHLCLCLSFLCLPNPDICLVESIEALTDVFF